ncbi:MAG: hypothetical protein F9K44_13820 [Hyphomicrobiaceae bacterium]|nr:MAG: hypothetical protein F9K44_13820 [Hyphomicrobiaceae bacterium]
MSILKIAVLAIAASALAGCGSQISTASLTGETKPKTAQSVDGGLAVSPNDPMAKPIQVAWTSARAQRCGFYFDPGKLRGSYVASEVAKGATADQVNKIERAYDYTRERVANQISGNADYCSNQTVAEIRQDLNRHLAGDYSVNAKKVAEKATFWDTLKGEDSGTKPFDYRSTFDKSRNSSTN